MPSRLRMFKSKPAYFLCVIGAVLPREIMDHKHTEELDLRDLGGVSRGIRVPVLEFWGGAVCPRTN